MYKAPNLSAASSPLMLSHVPLQDLLELDGPPEKFDAAQGGREGRDLDATELARAAQALGAGELLLNCIDRCGSAGCCLLRLTRPFAQGRLPASLPVISFSECEQDV